MQAGFIVQSLAVYINLHFFEIIFSPLGVKYSIRLTCLYYLLFYPVLLSDNMNARCTACIV
jgi:hypothetical protein